MATRNYRRAESVVQEISFPNVPDTEFKIIPGCGGCYCISRTGRVWSRLGGGGKILGEWRELRPQICKGYKFVILSRMAGINSRKSCYIHNLLLECFVGPRPEGLWGLHGDDVRSHNDLSNLEWGTPQQNAFDRSRNGKVIGESHGRSKLTAEAVLTARLLRKDGMTYREIKEKILTEFGIDVHQSLICHAVCGRTWKHLKDEIHTQASSPGCIGEKNGAAILTNEIVLYARELRREGIPYREIVEAINREFYVNVTYSLVYQAVISKSWKHLEGV